MAKRVGIVGIGIMGTAMMRNLAKDGFEVVGFDVVDRKDAQSDADSRRLLSSTLPQRLRDLKIGRYPLERLRERSGASSMARLA